MARRGRSRFIALTERIRQTHPDLTDLPTLIREAQVTVNGVIVTNAAAQVPADAAIRLRRPSEPRGRVKLAAALDTFAVPVRSRVAVDVGASTGGFTLALLEAGAQRVYAVDAGHGQLLGRLRNHPQVVNLERTNVGDLGRRHLPERVEIVTVDLSYLALADVAPQLEVLDIAPDADLVVLVKPMYELRLSAPPVDSASRLRAVELAVTGFDRCGWQLRRTVASPITGSHGAIEHFAHFGRRRQ